MEGSSKENNSKLIFALDVSDQDPMENALQILEETSRYVSGVKIGYLLVLRAGLEIVSRIKEGSDLPVIADFKIADVPHVNRLIAGNAFDAGADAVIAHAFLGHDSLKAVVEVARKNGKGVIAIPSMSHPGSETFIGPVSERMARMAVELGSDGLVGPATRVDEVKKLRSWVGDEVLIFSPGVGAQGGEPGDAVLAGADFEIVGRAIYASGDPEESSKKLRNRINERIGRKK